MSNGEKKLKEAGIQNEDDSLTSKNQWSKNGPFSSRWFSLLIVCWQPSLQLSTPLVAPEEAMQGHRNTHNTCQALPIPPGYNNILERNSHWETTVSHVRVNCSQHVCEQRCPHWILMRSQQGLRWVASWLCLAMFSVMLSCENKDRLSSRLNLLMFWRNRVLPKVPSIICESQAV